MFYDNFIKLCEEIGLSPTRVVVQAGLSKGSISRWKEGGEPLNEAKKRIADILGVTVPELMSGEKKKPASYGELSERDVMVLESFKQLTDDNKALVSALIARLRSDR